MPALIHEDFLLDDDISRELYTTYARGLPIIDYHSHLLPQAIAEDRCFKNLSEIWLEGDHYKWRAMRCLGVEEQYISGNASPWEKFRHWARVVPYTMRNPLYHWTHMELNNPFGIQTLLNEDSAAEIYKQTEQQLQTPDFSTKSLLQHFGVEMLGTTDDPFDTLEYHQAIAESGFSCKVSPSFRPDKFFQLGGGARFRAHLDQLQEQSGVQIRDLDSLLEALEKRIHYFHQHGCRISDHGLAWMPGPDHTRAATDAALRNVLEGRDEGAEALQGAFTYYILEALSAIYHKLDWVQQFHLGALRNNNTRAFDRLGPDAGYDSIGDYPQARALSYFLDQMEMRNQLPKTILYNLNPADNAVFAAMVGNYPQEGVRGKLQYGSAWWFMDQLDGMREHMNTLSNIGLISTFIGMLTDSRSFLSYSRHEYFRRLLCSMFARDIHAGLIPHDLPWIGKLIQDICYYNAKTYFNL